MGAYSVLFKESVRKDFDVIPAADARSIMKRIAALADNPRGLGCEKLSGQEKYCVRQGDWRILFSIRDDERTVCVVRIGRGRDVYRK